MIQVKLAGAFNPSEKYARQIGSFPQGSGWKKQMFEVSPPRKLNRTFWTDPKPAQNGSVEKPRSSVPFCKLFQGPQKASLRGANKRGLLDRPCSLFLRYDHPKQYIYYGQIPDKNGKK